MLLVLIVALGALLVPLLGGQLSSLADAHVPLGWLLLVALGLQVVAISVPGVPEPLRPVLQVASYPVAGIFVVANRHLRGMLLVGFGALSNLAAILANGGTMPAAPAALARAGLPAHPRRYVNSAAVAHPRLAWLGDVLALPHRYPLHNVFSVGDLLIAIGIVVAIHALCGSRLRLLPQRQKA